MYCYGEKVEGEEVRRVRVALDENQTEFGARFGKHRRTVIRWEKSQACFSRYGRWMWDNKKQQSVIEGETQEEIWKRAKAEAVKPKRKKKTRKAKRAKSRSDTRRRRKVSQVKKRRAAIRTVTRRRKHGRKVKHK